jgi:hypothetical protein
MFVKNGDPNPITVVDMPKEIDTTTIIASLKSAIKEVKSKQKKISAKKESETK